MQKNYNTIIKEIEVKLEPLYLIYGEEQYLVESLINKIKKKFGEIVQGINYVLIDETGIDEIIPNIQMPAFGYDKKLIIVKNSGLFKKDGRKKTGSPEQEEIADFIKNNMDVIKEDIILVFVEVSVDKNILYEQVEKSGIICNIEELKEFDLVKKLKQICNMYKVNVQDNVLQYLIQTSGTNMQILINEIRKLIEYAGSGGEIKKEDVDSLAVKQIESVIFELTDNLAIKKTKNALVILDNLIYQKEPIQKILVTLYNHFKKLYLCSIALDLNKDIITSLGLKPNQTFLVSKYKKQVACFKKEELRTLLEALIDLDYNYKIGKIDIDLGLRSILCNYCS